MAVTRRAVLLCALAALLFAQAQPAGKFALTVDNIMRGPNLVGYEPFHVRWSAGAERIYFEWKRYTDKPGAPSGTWVVGRDGTGLAKLSDAEARLSPPLPGSGNTSLDRRLMAYARDGDLFLYDRTAGSTRQLTRTADAETNPHFLRDGRRVAFTRANNLYVLSLADGALVQLTDIRAPPPAGASGDASGGRGGRGGAPPTAASGEPERGTDSQEYLKKEQKELLEAIRERVAIHEEEEARRKRENPRQPFTLQARQSVASLELSPDEKFVVAAIAEAGNGARNTIVPNYITESAYAEDIGGRTNVGDAQATARLAEIAVDTGEVKWVDHGQKGAVQLSPPLWSGDGSKAVIRARAADNKDRWLLALDPATAKTRVLASDHDDAWLNSATANTVGWMKNGREVYFLSERTGYAHLYAVDFGSGATRALTSGKWEVLDTHPSEDKSHFYITANKDTPYENHVYEMSDEGGPLTRLTRAPGKHTAAVSPDDRWIADIYSYTNRPPEIYVQENRPLAESRKLTSSPAPEFAQYAWLDAPIVTFQARDGVEVPARLFKPADFKEGGPAVVFVHGAGYLQNVDRWWSSNYYREYLFDHLLMERGFTVIDVDYRGSAGHGREWRTAIYRHMGGKDLDDIVDAARYLVARHGVDPKRIGLFGGSYGGFITLMAMFTQPDVFAAGAALRPVADWAFYNHSYTSDILNVPQGDAEAYRQSSPIYFAQGLKGALLICHGMVDTNVEFQDTVRLVQKLIELRKENWEVAVYPVENHGFTEETSWADEFKRILRLFEKNLK
jgi:dipeptidyl aminopeptidase/acylaminoacyl peptidase